MTVIACDVPQGSLLAGFGGPEDYRDCFCCEVAGRVDLGAFVESFYCSAAFRPERIFLGLLGRGASDADAQALARGEADGMAVWTVVERRDNEILLEANRTGTASWFSVALKQRSGSAENNALKQRSGSADKDAPDDTVAGQQTILRFGSWVGKIDQSGWRAMLRAHVWYSRVLLASAARGLA